MNRASSHKRRYSDRQTAHSATNKAAQPATRRRFSFSFAFRLGLAISALSIAGAVLLVYLAVRQHWTLANEQAQALGSTIAQQFADSVVEPIFIEDELTLQLNVSRLASRPLVRSVSIYSNTGEVIKSSLSQPRPFALLSDGYYTAPVTLSGATAAYAVVELDRRPVERVFDGSSRDLIAAVSVILLVSVLWAYGMSRVLSRPVHRLRELSHAAREGRLHGYTDMLSKQERDEWTDIMTVYDQLHQEVQGKHQAEKILGQFVASDVAKQLLQDGEAAVVSGARVDASVLFVDIVNFTQLAEPMQPDDVANMLNRYLSTFAACARIYQGAVDKFIGDAAMIVFGTPREDKLHREHALGCALAIQRVARQIDIKRESIGLKPIHLRIGVNSGKMRAGILGSEYRKEFTVVGDAVNLASRLCDSADPGQILVAESTIQPLQALIERGDLSVSSEDSLVVKGKTDPVAIYRLNHIRLSQSWVLTNLIEDIVAQH